MTIRAPCITPPKNVAGPSLLSITTASLALTAVVAAALPFNNSAALARTPAPVVRSATDQFHTDISKFINPIPFAQTQWGSVLSLNSLPTPPRVVPYNPNLYSTVAANPFIPPQFGAALSLNSLPTPPRAIPYNPNLYATIAAAPFSQSDWRAAFNIPGASPKAQNANALIYSEVPFSQSDWPRTVAVSYNPPQAQPYNPLILSEIPTNSVDYSKPLTVRSSPPQTQPYNAALYTTPVPFVPVDYNKPFGIANVPPALSLQGFNINLFGQTLVPFNVPFDVVRTPNFVQFTQGYNLNLYGTVQVAAPFFQTDWSKPSPPQLAVSQVAPTNINLFTNPIPFALYDWNKPSAYGPSKTPLPQTSIALFANLGPWTQTDFSKPAPYPSVPAAPLPVNVSLLTAIQAPPFIPVDYSKPYFPRNQIDATNAANPASFTNPQPIIPVDYNTVRQNPNFQIWAQQYNVNLFVPPPAPPVVKEVAGGKWHEGRYSRIRLKKEKKELEQLIAVLKSIPTPLTETSTPPAVVSTDHFRKLLEDYEVIRSEPDQPKQISKLVAEAARLIAQKQIEDDEDDEYAAFLLLS